MIGKICSSDKMMILTGENRRTRWKRGASPSATFCTANFDVYWPGIERGSPQWQAGDQPSHNLSFCGFRLIAVTINLEYLYRQYWLVFVKENASVHCEVRTELSNANKNPTDATVCRYLFTVKLLYMFRVSQHSSSGVSKTVPAASGTSSMTCTGGCGYSFWYSWWWVL